MNLKEIAQKAGVSTATVSYVINGRHHKVSKETIVRVQKVIEENNYKPNATARSLACKESKIIGVVVPPIREGVRSFTTPRDAHMLALLEQYVQEQGYLMLMYRASRSLEAIQVLTSRNADGIIFLGGGESEKTQQSIAVPTVYIDADKAGPDTINVRVDNYKGGYLAAKYLISQNHRDIALVGPDVSSSNAIHERFQGFRNGCEQKGITIGEEDLFLSDDLYQSGVKVGQQVASSKKTYTAVWAMSDIVAFGVMEGLRLCGISVPEDVSVMGFDNLPECIYTYPKLTTISQHLPEKARRAGELIFRQIQGGPGNDREQCALIDVELIERQSVVCKA